MSGDMRPAGRLSARVEPYWINPATIKGAVAILAGLFVLAIPDLSALLLRVVLASVLVVSGLTDLWFGIRRHQPRRGRAIAESLVSLAAGIALILFPAATLGAVIIVVSFYLATRGFAVITTALRFRARRQPWAVDFTRGVLFISLAAVVLTLSEGVIRATLAAAATSSVILGAIILGYGLRRRSENELIDIDVASVSVFVRDWLDSRDVGGEQRDRIGENFFFEEPERTRKLTSWWVMLLLSVAIATFGIIQDSTAVVIGAMLIAPLMTPILGVGAGIVNAWQGRVIASTILVMAGAAAAIGLAFVIGQWFPIIVPLAQNSQVISRVNPNLIDMMIALAAGAAGAYANVDKRVSDSIAGVAIAVALVPPLGVVGLTLQAGMFEESVGALLLFVTNLVSIILAATAVFFLSGYAPIRLLRDNKTEVTALLRTVTLAAVVILIPLALTAQRVVTGIARQAIANESVSDWINGFELSIVSVDVNGSDVHVLIRGADDPPNVEDLATTLNQGFGQVVTLQVEHAATTVYIVPDREQ